MARKYLKSNRVVESLPPPNGTAARYYWDTKLHGFGVVVGRTRRTFVFQRTLSGKRTRRTRLGHFGDRPGCLSVTEARKEAARLYARYTEGYDPSEITLRKALEQHIVRLENKDGSPRTIEGMRTEIEYHLADWLGRPLRTISSEDCFDRHVSIAKNRGKYAANRCMRYLRAIFNRAAKRYQLGENPTRGVEWYAEKAAQVKLTWDDLPAWHGKIQRINSIRRDYYLFTLFTGLRATDAKTARWEHVDFEAGTIHRPKPKGGADRAFTVPLSSHVLELLRRRREENLAIFTQGDGGWIFPAYTRGERRITHLAEPKERDPDTPPPRRRHKEKKTEYLPRPNQMRKLFSTAAREVGMGWYERKVLMNHRTPATDDVTDKHYFAGPSMEHLRACVEAVSEFLLAKLVSEPPSCREA